MATASINKSQKKITIGIYERVQKNNSFDDKLIDIIKYQYKNEQEFNKKIEDVQLEYANYDQQIHHEN